MIRSLVWISILASAAVAAAQQPAVAVTRQPTRPLEGEQKLRWITARLGLEGEAGKQLGDGLIQNYLHCRTASMDLNRIQELSLELQGAQERGDAETEKRVRQDLADIGTGAQCERDFMDTLRGNLNDGQKQRLKQILELLERNPSGKLRPIDVLRLAHSLTTSDQARSFERIEREFREKVNLTVDLQPTREKMLDTLIDDLRGVLPPDKVAEYDRQISMLREFTREPGSSSEQRG